MTTQLKFMEQEEGSRHSFPSREGFTEIVIFNEKTPTMGGKMGFGTFEPGARGPLHKHSLEEMFYFVKGSGKFVVGDNEIEIKPGRCLYIPADVPHYTVNTGSEKLEVVFFLAKDETTILE